ncbi:hypothetical protein NL676_008438 [Syzygium grande]|nr:hypothetical protein NL676_008438 [Syzygium grande]
MANRDPGSPAAVAASIRGSPCPNGNLDEVAHGVGGLDPSSQHNGRPWIEAQVALTPTASASASTPSAPVDADVVALALVDPSVSASTPCSCHRRPTKLYHAPHRPSFESLILRG